MTYDQLIAGAASAVGIATGAAYLPQAVRIWRRRSSDDVSVLSFLLFLTGQVVWLLYGIRFRQMPIVIGMVANITGNLIVILSAVRFRSRPGARVG